MTEIIYITKNQFSESRLTQAGTKSNNALLALLLLVPACVKLLAEPSALAKPTFDVVNYNFNSLLVEIGYCRYTSFVVRQDIDANTFVVANHNLVLAKS